MKIIQSRYVREGEQVLLGKGRGGRRSSNLTWEEEDELLSSFLEKARAGGMLVVPPNMRLAWLPPYSPQCNPVEHLWDEIREKWFENKVFDSMDAVEEILVEDLATLENENKRVLGLTGFDRIVCIPMNAP